MSKLWADAMKEEMNSLKENDSHSDPTARRQTSSWRSLGICSERAQMDLRLVKPNMSQRDGLSRRD